MNLRKRIGFHPLVVSLLLLSASAAFATAPFPPFTAEFTLFRDNEQVGQSVIELKPHGNAEWLIETRTNASLYTFNFSDREQSRFRWLNGKPQPLAFEKERQRPGKTEIVHQRFDWQQMTDSGERGKKTWSTALTTGTQDLQSHLLLLQLDLRAGKRELNYPVSKNGRVRDYHYAVVKEEQLETALGTLNVLRVERIRDPGDDRQTISWFAPTLDFLPVRIQQYEDGVQQGDMQIRKLSR